MRTHQLWKLEWIVSAMSVGEEVAEARGFLDGVLDDKAYVPFIRLVALQPHALEHHPGGVVEGVAPLAAEVVVAALGGGTVVVPAEARQLGRRGGVRQDTAEKWLPGTSILLLFRYV